MNWPFGSFLPGDFDVISGDPPWRLRNWNMNNQRKSASRYYSLMTTEEICKLPVGDLASKNSILLLWSSAPMLPQAFNVASSWGFKKYVSRMSWRKVYASGKPCMGCGYWVRTMHEDVLIFTKGAPKISKAFPSLFDGVRREHSRKPEEYYQLVEERTPDARRLDLFSRESRAGWSFWGNEAGKFDAQAAD